MATFRAVHPVLNVRDVRATGSWFGQLGFEGVFVDDPARPRYGGVRRGGVEFHLQWHSSDEWASGLDGAAYRCLVDDPDELHAEWMGSGVDLQGASPTNTGWGTREFGLYDPDRNALFFYRDLTERDL